MLEITPERVPPAITSPEAPKPSFYGILVGRIKAGEMSPPGISQHFEIWVAVDSASSLPANYRIAVNARSVDGSEVLAYFDGNYTNPTKLDLPSRAAGVQGFTPIATGPQGGGLDYLHDNLFPLNKMGPIPPEAAQVTLATMLNAQIERAKADPGAIILAAGEFFADQGSDQSFGFSPEQGVHDIHMMQGNVGRFASDNRQNGDGALFIRFTGGQTIALFVRFQTQQITV